MEETTWNFRVQKAFMYLAIAGGGAYCVDHTTGHTVCLLMKCPYWDLGRSVVGLQRSRQKKFLEPSHFPEDLYTREGWKSNLGMVCEPRNNRSFFAQIEAVYICFVMSVAIIFNRWLLIYFDHPDRW